MSLSGFRINYNVRAHHIKEICHQMQQCYVFFNSFYAPYYALQLFILEWFKMTQCGNLTIIPRHVLNHLHYYNCKHCSGSVVEVTTTQAAWLLSHPSVE